MSGNGPALLAASAGVGFGHAILPDHWVPLAVLGRTRRYPLSRVAHLSGLAALAHVAVSIVLGGVIIAVGLQFRSAVESAQNTIVGCALVATGGAFAVMEWRGHARGHEHSRDDPARAALPDHRGHDVELADGPHRASRFQSLAAVMVPFGAAASPDLTILPVFLAAATVGAATALGSLIIFAAVTIGTIVGLTLAATRGGYQVRGQWLERWGNLLTAFTLIVIGMLVLLGLI